MSDGKADRFLVDNPRWLWGSMQACTYSTVWAHTRVYFWPAREILPLYWACDRRKKGAFCPLRWNRGGDCGSVSVRSYVPRGISDTIGPIFKTLEWMVHHAIEIWHLRNYTDCRDGGAITRDWTWKRWKVMALTPFNRDSWNSLHRSLIIRGGRHVYCWLVPWWIE